MDERARLDDSEQDPDLPADPVAAPEPSPTSRPPWWWRLTLYLTRALATLLSIAVLATMGYGWWAFGDVDATTVTTDVIASEVADEPVPLDGAVDMLLVGIDSRTDANGDPLPREVLDMLHAGVADGVRNTDTMILVHIPVDGTRAVAISFPRDSWVELAGGFGKHRLNSAFVYAYNDARERLTNSGLTDPRLLENQAAIAGRKNLIATIENLVGRVVTIDRYAEVNLASFYEVTKAIGGVEVCLNEAVDDPKSGASFPQGRQTVSGAQALAFVRQRYGLPNGDLDRIMRQQVFLGALADKVLSANMLTSPMKARELISAVQRSVVLSRGWELSTFAAQMQGLSSGSIDFHTIPTQGNARIGGADVLKVDPNEVQAFVAALTSDQTGPGPSTSTSPSTSSSTVPSTPVRPTTSAPSETAPPAARPRNAITVEVRNASRTARLATTVQDQLVAKGYLRGTVGDAPAQAQSVITYAAGDQYSAQMVANDLGGQFAMEPDLTLPAGRVRVVLGTEYVAGLNPQMVGPRGAHVPPSTTSPPPSTVVPPSSPRVIAGKVTCVN